MLLSSHDQEVRCRHSILQVVFILPSALLTLCFVPHSTLLPSHVCSQFRLQSRREGTFRHMDLPFVYQLLDKGVSHEGADL